MNLDLFKAYFDKKEYKVCPNQLLHFCQKN